MKIVTDVLQSIVDGAEKLREAQFRYGSKQLDERMDFCGVKLSTLADDIERLAQAYVICAHGLENIVDRGETHYSYVITAKTTLDEAEKILLDEQ